MANTISSRTWRDAYKQNVIQTVLRGAMVTEAITDVRRGNDYRILNPYSADPTVTVQALAGTYSIADWTTVDDTLTVTDEFIIAEHVHDFEELMTNFDMFATRVERQAFAVAKKIDEFVLNNLCEDGTGTYTTPGGGFATAANVNSIFASLASQLDGYDEAYEGRYVVVENTDMVGIRTAGATNGFTFSDGVLNNGKVSSWMGIDIYVVRTGTFTDATVGTKTWTNSGHRVAGVKRVATVAMPGGLRFEEKGVSGKTGMEVVTYGYIGFKAWAPMLALTIDITLA